MEIGNFRHRGRIVALRLDNGGMRVSIDGTAVYDGAVAALTV